MPSEGVDRLRAAYEAFARQDIETVMAAFDQEIEWHAPDVLPFGGTFHGHQGVGQFLAMLPQYFRELSVEPHEFIEAGDVVAVPARLRGSGAGGSFDSETLHLYRMRDGKAVWLREFPDTARVLQALGMQVPAPV